MNRRGFLATLAAVFGAKATAPAVAAGLGPVAEAGPVLAGVDGGGFDDLVGFHIYRDGELIKTIAVQCAADIMRGGQLAAAMHREFGPHQFASSTAAAPDSDAVTCGSAECAAGPLSSSVRA